MALDGDLLQQPAIDWNYAIAETALRIGVPADVAAWIPAVLNLVEPIALVVVLAAIIDRIEWACCDRTGGRGGSALAVRALATAIAVPLLGWTYLHPSGDLTAFVCRWDYLAFAILAGMALRALPFRARIVTLAVLSVVLVVRYTARVPSLLVVGGGLLGYAAERWQLARRPAGRAVVQGALLLAVALALWRYRAVNSLNALRGLGLFVFVAFRHVSFVVESARGVQSSFCGYLCFLLFYPSCVGAMEVYNEFWERNLAAPAPRDYPRATRIVVKGMVLLWLGVLVPVDHDRFTQSVGFVQTWTNALVFFLRTALAAMGFWSIIEGGALYLDVRLRPNFPAVLGATNPSAFWRSWRATMTNWLVRYVYIPLGGNRRHQTLNILAVFVVSTAWHCVSPPFLRPTTWGAYDLAPLVLWGVVNFVGVAAHARLRRRSSPDPSRPLPWLRVALKWAPTMLFASVTTCLLGFGLAHIERFGTIARSLVGLEGW